MKRALVCGPAVWLAVAVVAIVAAAALPGCASAPVDPDCPQAASELPVDALYGRWEARFDGLPDVAGVQLAKHPEYAGSVRGTIVRSGTTAQLSGDIDDAGLLTLDESADGRSISAVWSGELRAGSCGKEFKGTWRNSNDDSTRTFVLHKTGGLP